MRKRSQELTQCDGSLASDGGSAAANNKLYKFSCLYVCTLKRGLYIPFNFRFHFECSFMQCNMRLLCCLRANKLDDEMRLMIGKAIFSHAWKIVLSSSLLFAFEKKNSTKKERSELLASFKIGSGWLARALIDRRFYAAADAVFFYVSKKLEKFHDPVNYIFQLSSKRIRFDPYTLIFFQDFFHLIIIKFLFICDASSRALTREWRLYEEKRQIFTRRSSFESHYCTQLKLGITTTTADISSHLADPTRDPAVANNSNKDVRRKLMSWFIGGIVELLNGRCFCVEYLVYAKACARLQLSKLSLIFFLHNFTIVIVTALTVCCRHRTHWMPDETSDPSRDSYLRDFEACISMTKWATFRRLCDCVCEYEFCECRSHRRTNRSVACRSSKWAIGSDEIYFCGKIPRLTDRASSKKSQISSLDQKKICRCLIKNGDKTLLKRKHSSGSEFWKIPFCLPSTP